MEVHLVLLATGHEEHVDVVGRQELLDGVLPPLLPPSGNGSHQPSSVSTALYPRATSSPTMLDFPAPVIPVSSTRFTVAGGLSAA